jgi:cytochrome c
MNTTVTSKRDIRKPHGRKLVINRRSTFMLALASIVGLAAPSRQAFAGLSEDDGTISAGKHVNPGGAASPKRASVSQLPDLKVVGPQGQVTSIQHHRGTFEITTADGGKAVFREAALRLKIDSSDKGPLAGRPVILPGGMMGDRASLFFASPAEMSRLIKHLS